jgi:hypothetical protein
MHPISSSCDDERPELTEEQEAVLKINFVHTLTCPLIPSFIHELIKLKTIYDLKRKE